MPSKTSGLPPRVFDSVSDVARKYPETDRDAIQNANREFRAYLSWRRAMATRRKSGA